MAERTPKYDLIIEVGHHLFWKHGIRRVSIEEVCREAGVSKMTFYRNFDNKVDLAKKVIENLFIEMESQYRELMAQEISFEEKIKQQVVMKFEGTKEISAELIKDIYSDWNEELKALFQQKAGRMTQLVYNDYQHAIDQGWIRKDVKLDFIFYMSNKMTEMASDPQLQAIYPNPQDMIMEFMNMLFYGILPRKDA